MTLHLQPADEPALESSLRLDEIVFDGDRDLRAALLADKRFVRILVGHAEDSPALSARRQLLLSALRLGPGIAPEPFAALEEVRRVLGLRATVELYCVPRKEINAFVVPPEGGVVLVGLTSEALERLDSAELRFVLGHELGHVLFDHLRMTPDRLLSDERLAPVHVARLCAWLRYAELTADRVGLLCADDFEAAVRAFFKLTSGLSAAHYLQHADDCARQLAELEAKQMESTEQDWFSTHPYSPLRVKALDLFARSETFHRLRGRSGSEAAFHRLLGKSGKPLPEAELEQEVTRIMKLMDPSFLHSGDGEERSATREFLALAGLAVACADGKIVASEERALKKMIGKRGVLADATGLRELSPEAQEQRLRQLARELSLSLSTVRRCKLVEDLVAVALADRRLEKQELEVLRGAAELLGVEPQFVAEAVARAARTLD
jgi:uncharacterized tellurite resistance protein B-like protein